MLLVSSLTHRGGRLDFLDLQAERRYDALGQYAATKLAAVVTAKELQRRFDRCVGKGSPRMRVRLEANVRVRSHVSIEVGVAVRFNPGHMGECRKDATVYTA